MEALEKIDENLRELIDANFEWLLVRENGKTFPLRKTEIDVVRNRSEILLEVLAENGFQALRVQSFAIEGSEIHIDVATNLGCDEETIRFVPRVSARDLAAEIELARLAKANEIAALISESFPGTKIARVTLNADNGRLVQIALETCERQQAIALSDISASLGPEMLLTTAVLTLREFQDRKNKPVSEVWLIGEKKQAKKLQKLHALLTDRHKSRYRIFEIAPKAGKPCLVGRRKEKLSNLWREKPKKISLPAEIEPGETAKGIIDLDPEKIDVVFSKQGETLRFLGLPFARVRKVLGREKAWFGVERDRRSLNESNWEEFTAFVGDLQTYRSSDTEHRRHELYRAAPEAWLESILRRNIKLLDANLVLSPLYNQFRAASDKIDLLAIRRDGRLVIIELKTSPDRETVFQAADYWRKIELQRRKGELRKARAFGDMEILDKPALVYVVAPALSFHREFAYFARMLSKEVELWRFELHENWRSEIKVLTRRDYSPELFTNL